MKGSVRHELGDNHTYDYVDGTVKFPIASEIEIIFPKDDQYFTYFNDVATGKKAIEDLRQFVKLEGPFDGIIGFCNGSLLATAMLIQDSESGILDPNIKLAILFSNQRLANWKLLITKSDRVSIGIPTAHIWGKNDNLSMDAPRVIAELCNPSMRSIFVHDGGHEVPSGKDKSAVISSVNIIRRAINAAL
ncbi:hypothetical protein HYALB_00011014 [Hymenoscyphus albidus]|uniref:Serine hydrolase domain-containing protein n=1 Tax=Hymenoscyphus albidus TaxID=595503 RepID=A0A9N9LQ36_9HELO|nr:hypothetical protein HYALB_00011014 [Hymenoscyphus albidus]